MSDERRPDVVTFTYETTVDYVVDLKTGEVKREDNGDLGEDPHFVALFCEGEFAGEADLVNGEPENEDSLEEGDKAVIDQAYEILDTAFQAGTVVRSTTPEAIG